MNNPFQEQLLKAGLVSKQQVNRINQEKQKKKKQQRSKKPGNEVNANQLKAQQAAQKKAELDRELNRKKQEQAHKKALSAEIDQLIKNNAIKRNDGCELAYNFEHYGKVKRVYINQDMKQQILTGKLGIARITGNYELVPISVAEKIKQRNEKRVIIFEPEQQKTSENDPYADYEIPDDLMW